MGEILLLFLGAYYFLYQNNNKNINSAFGVSRKI